MTSLDERVVFAKLEALKEIRSKTLQLEKLKSRIIKEIETTDQEEKCLLEYKQEMDLLLQEKMSHVEELRQIHADINAMEGVIKNSEESRVRALNAATRIHEEYRPLKAEIDRLRRDCLGLDRLPELHEEEGSIITPETKFPEEAGILSNQALDLKFNIQPNPKQQFSFNRFANHFYPPSKLHSQQFIGKTGGGEWSRPLQAGDGSLASLAPPLAPTFLPPPTPLRLVASKPEPGRPTPSINLSTQPGPPTPTFRSDFVNLRQQPPPMKSCLSCHQQIHRNAPICPLCKAKSRSRNPKKPKKKDH